MSGTSGGGGGASPSFVLEAALRLAALNLFPIPVERGGKRPKIPWKPLVGRALLEYPPDRAEDYIQRWWGGERPHNVAVLTGAKVWIDGERWRRLVVLDLDDTAAKERVRDAVTRPTPAARTPSGGLHLWYLHDGDVGNRAKVDGVGLDVRGLGGFVVAPPSIGANGRPYEWVVSPREVWPPAPLPDELARLIWPPKPPAPPERRFPRAAVGERYAQVALEREAAAVASAPEGTRNDQLNRSCYAVGRLIADGRLSADDVERVMLEAARRAGLPDREALATIRSALRGRGAA